MKNGYINITLNRIKDSGELSPACHFCGDSDEILNHGICPQCRKHTAISMSKLKDMYNKGLGPIFRHVKAMTVTDSLYLVQTIVPNEPIVWPHTLHVMGELYLEGNGAVLNLPKKYGWQRV